MPKILTPFAIILGFLPAIGEARLDFSGIRRTRSENSPRHESASLADRCATDLIGGVDRFRVRDPGKTFDFFIDTQVAPLLDRIIRSEEMFAKTAARKFDGILADVAGSARRDDVRIIATVMLILDRMNASGDLFPASLQTDRARVDRAAWASSLSEFPRATADLLADAMEALINDPVLQASLDQRRQNYAFLVTLIDGNALLPEGGSRLQWIARRDLGWIAEFERRFGKTSSMRSAESVLRKIADGTVPLTTVEQARFAAFFVERTRLELITNGEVGKILAKANVGLPDIAAALGVMKNLRAVNVEIAGNGILVIADTNRVLRECRARVKDVLAHSPTLSQIANARVLAEKVRSAAIGTLSAYFGNEKSGISERLRTLRFDFPTDSGGAKSWILSQLQAANTGISQQLAQMDSPIAAERAGALLRIFEGYSGWNGDSGPSASRSYRLTSLRYACADLKKAYSSFGLDAYASGDVYVGWQSVFWPETGVSVLAHEVGHAALRITPSTSGALEVAKSLACVHENRAKLGGERASDITVSRFDDEDWADVFAASVVRRMTTEGTRAEGFLLSLLALTDPETGKRLCPPELLTSNPLGIHSGLLARELSFALGIGRSLPESCRKIPGVAELRGCSK